MRIFVTGGSGWIGSAVVPELIGAGHEVTGLARSDASAAVLRAAGARVQRGSLADLDVLRAAAQACDGVIHLAFQHDLAFSGNFEAAAAADRRAVETFGAALAGSGKPFVLASGLLGLGPGGRAATEDDRPDLSGPADQHPGPRARQETAQLVLGLAGRGIRSSVLRLPPTVHGEGDTGFIGVLAGVAREKGVCGYPGDGANRWPAVHRLDAAHLFRLAAESAPAGSALHAVADEGVPVREIAEVIGRQLGLPAVPVPVADALAHFGWLGAFITVDSPASAAITRKLLGWEPVHPGLLDDLEKGYYTR
jgi:nucleoside-diphosphate-sugar epimerase